MSKYGSIILQKPLVSVFELEYLPHVYDKLSVIWKKDGAYDFNKMS